MRKLLNIFIIILLLTTGCSASKDTIKHNYKYNGESDNWSAKCEIDGVETYIDDGDKLHHEGHITRLLTVTYKGDISELDSINSLIISIQSTFSQTTITEYFDNDTKPKKTYTLESSRSNNLIEIKDDFIKVTITIDGNEETIELIN